MPGTAPESFYTNEFLGKVPRLPVPRLPPGGRLGTPKILGTGATLHLVPVCLHVKNWECKWRVNGVAPIQKLRNFVLKQNYGNKLFAVNDNLKTAKVCVETILPKSS